MSAGVPYIGSKISLVSNSEIRYEGVLYTINTQESTIALQAVHCFGTEGRKHPEIPASSEVYDFIIFRGQDIKDLTVLESCSVANDPAIVSINEKPKGASKGPGAAGGKGSSSAHAGYEEKGGKGSRGGWAGGGAAWGGASSGSWGGWGASGGGYGTGGYGSYNAWGASGTGKGASGKGDGKGKKGAEGVGKGKGDVKGRKGDTGKGKGPGLGKGKESGKGKGKDSGKGFGKDSGKKGGDKGGKRAGTRSAGLNSGIPVGELQPEENAEVKKELAEDFDVTAANEKFDKVMTLEGTEGVEDRLKPLPGYDKSKSFFDSISCEATERPAESERPKIDREKAREFDKETFGDTRRPPRPAGGRPGKGRRRGGSGKGYRG